MLTRTFILLFILSSIGFHAQAQKKIKYKNLYPVIASGNFEEGESDLRAFLLQEPDHPNANLYMAIMLRKQLDTLDILVQKSRYIELSDSVILYLNNAKRYIDEREIKKNDDYYLAYNRRDMRTGKTGIKLSDIHLDIDNRIKALNETKQNINLATAEMQKVDMEFEQLLKQYKNITAGYDSEKQLLLRFDDALEIELKKLAIQYDILIKAFQEFNKQVSVLKGGATKHINEMAISDFKKDGYDAPDLLGETVDFWNHKQWANDILLTATNEIRNIKQQLVDIGKSYQKVKSEIKLLRKPDVQFLSPDENLISNLKDYDPSAIFIDLLAYQKNSVQHEILSSAVSNPVLRDTVFVDSLYSTYTKLEHIASELERLGMSLTDVSNAPKLDNYNTLIKTLYGDKVKLLTDIKNEIANHRMKKADYTELKEKWGERSKWGIFEDKRVPLFVETELSTDEKIGLGTLQIIKSSFNGQYAAGTKGENEVFVAEVNPDKSGKWFWSGGANNLENLETISLKYDNLNCLMLLDFGSADASSLYMFDMNGKLSWKVDLTIETKVNDIEIGEQIELVSDKGELLARLTKTGELLN